MTSRDQFHAAEIAEELQGRLWAARRRVAELIEEEESVRDTCNDIRAAIVMAERVLAERDVDFLEAALSDALNAWRAVAITRQGRCRRQYASN